MSPTLRIALRFLTAKKRAMLMSLSCTVLGVGLFVVTQATTSGFEKFFIKAILGADGAIRIEDKIQDTLRSISFGGDTDFSVREKEGRKFIEGVEEPKLVIDALKVFNNVSAASPVIRANVIVNSAFKNDSAQVFGISIDDHMKVSDLDKHIAVGTLAKFRETPTGALIGRELANRLQLTVDDSFIIDAHQESRRFRVSAIYETGVSDIDKVRIYVHMGEARSLLKKPFGVSFVQVSLFDPNRAKEDAERMQETLGYSAKYWQYRERVWIGVFHALRTMSGITVTVFTLIASLAMFNTLAMIVLEKTKDIAILRSMGYERRDITEIFLWQAVIVLTIGAVIGGLFGAGVTWAVNQVPLPINGIFKTETFPVTWETRHYVEAVAMAVVMVMIASLVPARRAARLEPGDIIRGTAQ